MENTGDSWLSRTNAAGIVVHSPDPPRRGGLETESPPGRPKNWFFATEPLLSAPEEAKGKGREG